MELDELGLSENLVRRVQFLIAWFDTSIDWSSPAGPSPWSAEQRIDFSRAAQDLLSQLRGALGSDFIIFDESDTATSLI